MNMKERLANFMLNILVGSLERTNKRGSYIRFTRLKKLTKGSKKIAILAQLLTIWYIAIFMGVYLTSDTGAYFNDVERIKGTISALPDFCMDEEYFEKNKPFCQPNNNNLELGNESKGSPAAQKDFEFGDEDYPEHQNEYCPEGNCNNQNENGNSGNIRIDNNGNSQNEKDSNEKNESPTDNQNKANEESDDTNAVNQETIGNNPVTTEELSEESSLIEESSVNGSTK